MKKLIAILFMGALLTACGGSEDVSPTDTTLVAAEPEFEAETTEIDSYVYEEGYYPVYAFCDNGNRVYVGPDNMVVIEKETKCWRLFNE